MERRGVPHRLHLRRPALGLAVLADLGPAAAITAGPKYDGTSNYPASYVGQLFIADYARKDSTKFWLNSLLVVSMLLVLVVGTYVLLTFDPNIA